MGRYTWVFGRCRIFKEIILMFSEGEIKRLTN